MSAKRKSSAPDHGDVLDNSQLLTSLATNGKVELAALFARSRENLKQVVSLRLDSRLQARIDPSDIVQEAYVRAAKGLKTFLDQPTVHPVVWLRLLVKNLVIETHRKHFRAKRSPAAEVQQFESDGEPAIQFIADSLHSVHAAVAQAELVEKVRQMFRQMPDNDREVLDMRHTDGLSIAEIAAELQIPNETVKKRYYRALERFRQLAGDLLDQ